MKQVMDLLRYLYACLYNPCVTFLPSGIRHAVHLQNPRGCGPDVL